MYYKHDFKDQKPQIDFGVIIEKMQKVQEYIQSNYLAQNGPVFHEQIMYNPYVWAAYGIDQKGIYAEFGDHSRSDGRYYFDTQPKDFNCWTRMRVGFSIGQFILLNWPDIKTMLNNKVIAEESTKQTIQDFVV